MKTSNGIIGSPKINLLKVYQQVDNVCNSKENTGKPLVTIVITTYNSEVTIEECFERPIVTGLSAEAS